MMSRYISNFHIIQATLNGSVLEFFTVHHKLKWSVNEGDLFGMPKNRMYQICI